MSQTGQRPSPLAVGVDLGGTWLRLVALRDGQVIRRTRRTIPLSQVSKFLPTHLGGATTIGALVIVARAIVTTGQAELAALALSVIRQLRLRPPVSVSWAGGLLAHAWYRAGVRRALARRVRCRWRPPRIDPALAAARLAARLAARGGR